MLTLRTEKGTSVQPGWLDAFDGWVPQSSRLLTATIILSIVLVVSLAKAVLIPVVLALFAYTVLRPVTRVLDRMHVPPRIGVAVMLVAIVGFIGFASLQLIDPAKEWIANAPDRLTTVEKKVRDMVRPFDQIRRVADDMGDIAVTADTKTRAVSIKNRSFSDAVWGGIQATVVNGFIITVLLYFLLVSGDHLMADISRILWKADGGSVVKVIRNIESRLSKYLFTVAIINICTGVVIGLGMEFIGLPSPALWGVVAGLLNFVPYLGALTGEIVVAMAALSSFESVGHALMAPLIYFVISFIEGNFITPMILGRRFTVNPVLIILSMMFWGWIWGTIGLFLAVPILVLATSLRESIAPRRRALGVRATSVAPQRRREGARTASVPGRVGLHESNGAARSKLEQGV